MNGGGIQHNPTGCETDDTVGVVKCMLQIVSRKNQSCAALLRQSVKHAHDLGPSDRIEAGGRFVRYHQFRSMDQCPGNRHPLGLATRQGIGPVKSAVRQPDRRQRVQGIRAQLFRGERLAPGTPAVALAQCAIDDIRKRARSPHQSVELKHEAKPTAERCALPPVRLFRKTLAENLDRTVSERQQSDETPEQGGLARAV